MKKYINFRPAVLIPVSYIIGIAAYILGLKLHIITGILLVFTPVVIGTVFSIFMRKRIYKVILYTALFQIVLLLGFYNIKIRADIFYVEPFSGECEVTAVFDGSSVYGKSEYTYFKNVKIVYENRTIKAKRICVVTEESIDLDIGDIVEFKATLSSADKYTATGELNFNDLSNGIIATGYSDFSSINIKGNRTDIFGSVRNYVCNNIKSGMNGENASIVIAMLFGDKSEVSREILSEMRYAGIAHIFAVSGLHVGFISMLVYYILGKCKINSKVTCFLSIFITFLYCGLCGFSPSSVRAFLMFSFSVIFKTFGLKTDMLNSIFLSALVILVVKPQFLLSYGFILSYTAVISIAVFTGTFSRWLSFLPCGINGAVSTVLSVQIGTLPISALLFGYFTWMAFLLNLIIIPVISVVFMFTVISVVLSAVTTLTSVFLFLPDFIMGLFVKFLSDINFSNFVVNTSASSYLVVLFYAGVLFASDLTNFKFSTKIGVFTVTTIICMVFSQLFAVGIL